ncbi:MAG: Crp/Fnr family transcriptional regulator [Leptothrix sp. (in: Bacteria)]|nr:Crp/Fnr family transcriptional regulator [Leptothrix sp. (in: b-proteobacteria)]
MLPLLPIRGAGTGSAAQWPLPSAANQEPAAMLAKTVPPLLAQAIHPQAQACAACPVRDTALFGVLGQGSIRHIYAGIDSLALAAEARVYARGEPGTAVYTVRAGIVRFQRVTGGGERRIVRLAGRGDLLGPEALLQQPYADEAVACTAVQLCRIPVNLIDRLAQADPGLNQELMRRWQRALEQAGAWAVELSSGVARQRVLKLLAELARLADGSAEIWLPRREDIGAMLGLTVETASRMVSQLRREGVMTSLSRRCAALDTAALAAALRAG